MKNSNKILLGGLAVAGTYAGVKVYRKYNTAKDILPKFEVVKGVKLVRFNLDFQLPFSIVNTHNESISITGFGGKVYYKGEEITSFYLSDGITIEPTSRNYYDAKCSIYIPDLVGKRLVNDLSKPLNFTLKGAFYVLGLPIPYEQEITVTIASNIITGIKTVLTLFKNKQ